MKKYILLILCLAIALPLSAQDRTFGVGIIVGEPTGLSLKGWTSPTTAFDAAAAWSFEGRESFHLHLTYLAHNFEVFTPRKGRTAFYYGLGGRVRFRDGADSKIGLRAPVGLSYEFAEAPYELFAELAPILDFRPSTDLTFNGAIGFRFYFQ